MSFLDWLSDPDDPRVVFALTKRCGICGAPPKEKCLRPIYKRLIHQDRAERHWDNAKKGQE